MRSDFAKIVPHSLTGRESHNPVVANMRFHRVIKQRTYKSQCMLKRRNIKIFTEKASEYREKIDEILKSTVLEAKNSEIKLELSTLLTRAYLHVADVMAPEISHPARGYSSRSEKSLGKAQVQMVEAKVDFHVKGSVIGSSQHTKYILAVKKYEDLDLKVKKDEQKVYERALQRFRQNGDFSELHRALRQKKSGKSTSTRIECLVGRDGVACYKASEMCAIMARNLTDLYDEDEIPIDDTDELWDFRSVCDSPITDEEISDAIKGLKIKKAPGIDGICSEMVIGATPTQVDAFLVVFNSVLGGEDPWENDIKIPIYKKKGQS